MFGLIKVKYFQFQNIWSQWTTSQKKLFFVLEYVQIAPSSHKIEVDIVNAGMSQTLSYFQSSVTPPMELTLPNFSRSKVNSSGWVGGEKKTKRKRQAFDATVCASIFGPVFVLTFGLISFCAYTGSYKIYLVGFNIWCKICVTHIPLSIFELLESVWKEGTLVHRLSKGNCIIPI